MQSDRDHRSISNTLRSILTSHNGLTLESQGNNKTRGVNQRSLIDSMYDRPATIMIQERETANAE